MANSVPRIRSQRLFFRLPTDPLVPGTIPQIMHQLVSRPSHQSYLIQNLNLLTQALK